MTRIDLADMLINKGHKVSAKEIKYWEKDGKYPDITVIYALSEILSLNPNELLEAKQLMQAAGLNAIDMVTMRVICNFIDITIWKVHQINQVMFWIVLISILGCSWNIQIPIIYSLYCKIRELLGM